MDADLPWGEVAETLTWLLPPYGEAIRVEIGAEALSTEQREDLVTPTSAPQRSRSEWADHRFTERAGPSGGSSGFANRE